LNLTGCGFFEKSEIPSHVVLYFHFVRDLFGQYGRRFSTCPSSRGTNLVLPFALHPLIFLFSPFALYPRVFQLRGGHSLRCWFKAGTWSDQHFLIRSSTCSPFMVFHFFSSCPPQFVAAITLPPLLLLSFSINFFLSSRGWQTFCKRKRPSPGLRRATLTWRGRPFYSKEEKLPAPPLTPDFCSLREECR